MSNAFDLPARNSIPVNEPGSAAYRRLQRAKKGRVKGGDEQPVNRGWKPQKSRQDAPVQRPVRGKKG